MHPEVDTLLVADRCPVVGMLLVALLLVADSLLDLEDILAVEILPGVVEGKIEVGKLPAEDMRLVVAASERLRFVVVMGLGAPAEVVEYPGPVAGLRPVEVAEADFGLVVAIDH